MSETQGSGSNSRFRDAKGRERSRAGSHTSAAPSQRSRTTDPSRLVAFDVLRQVDVEDAYANLLLPALLRQRNIRGRDAAFATELTYGTLRLQGRYDAIIAASTSRPLAEVDADVLDVLRLGAHQLLGMRVPPHAAVSETVGLTRDRVGAGAAQFVNAVLRTISSRDLEAWIDEVAPDPETDALGYAEVAYSHPQWIIRAMRESLAMNGRPVSEIDALLEADNQVGPLSLVARPTLISPEALTAELRSDSEPGRYAPTAVRWQGDPRAIPAIRDGLAGVQDEGSQLVALVLAEVEVEAGLERWLDLCAGPGGKAALLGALARERGFSLVANEISAHRAELVARATDALADTVEVVMGDGREFEDPDGFDRVLVDAPCTGLGALRRRPEARWRRTPADVGALAPLQRELLHAALEATKPGGIVGYATCSPHVAETTLVVDDVLRKFPDAERVDLTDVVEKVTQGKLTDAVVRGSMQLWPHLHDTDAMHLTVLRRVR